MKEFLKWLGVNEKIAKLVVWLLFIMIFLILLNTLLDSLGLPFYKLTVQNLSKIKLNDLLNYMCTVIVSLLNFYSIIFLVIRLKKFKKVLPFSILYIIIMMISSEIMPYIIQQLCIPIFIAFITYKISDGNKKFILYGLLSLFFNTLIQYVCFFLFKIRFVGFEILTGFSYLISSLDYFIVMFFIILVKEVYLKYKKEA